MLIEEFKTYLSNIVNGMACSCICLLLELFSRYLPYGLFILIGFVYFYVSFSLSANFYLVRCKFLRCRETEATTKWNINFSHCYHYVKLARNNTTRMSAISLSLHFIESTANSMETISFFLSMCFSL